MAFCTSCGTAVVAGNRFCIACGSQLQATAAFQGAQQAAPRGKPVLAISDDMLRMFTILAGGLALIGGFLATAALFLPSSSPDRLWFFWTWRWESFRWEFVGSVLPLYIAGALTLALGRKSPRWALGSVAAAVFAIARVCALWAQSSEYGGFLHPPSLKSLALLIAVAASAVSGALAVAVVLRGDPPLLRIQSNIVKNALITGAMLSLANVVALQWISPPENFLSVNTVGFHTGVPVAVALTLLLVALLYPLALVAGAICGPKAAAAVGTTITGAWIAFVADGLRGLGKADGYRTSPGIGFILALIAGVFLARFVQTTMSAARVQGQQGSQGEDTVFPYVVAVRTVLALVATYLLLLMPLHILTTGYRADGRACDTPIDAVLKREYRTREVGGSVDPITNGYTVRRVREEFPSPCKDAAPGRLVIAGLGFLLIGGDLAAAWIAAPLVVRRLGLAPPERATTSA